LIEEKFVRVDPLMKKMTKLDHLEEVKVVTRFP
jgi:hypothetical protein